MLENLKMSPVVLDVKLNKNLTSYDYQKFTDALYHDKGFGVIKSNPIKHISKRVMVSWINRFINHLDKYKFFSLLIHYPVF